MCQDFNHFSGLLHHFVLAKLASSSIRSGIARGLESHLSVTSLGDKDQGGPLYDSLHYIEVAQHVQNATFGLFAAARLLTLGDLPVAYPVDRHSRRDETCAGEKNFEKSLYNA